MLKDIKKIQDNTNDELYELKNRNGNNKLFFKNEKANINKNDNNELNGKLISPKDNGKNNTHIKKNFHYKDVPLTVFF